MNARKLTTVESASLAALNASGLMSTLLFVTATGLRKSILDATAQMRSLFRTNGVHEYEDQPTGPAARVIKSAVIWNAVAAVPTSVSLYRPHTKGGDPRFWPYGLKEHAGADDVIAVFIVGGEVQLINLTRVDVVGALSMNPALNRLLVRSRAGSSKIADELRERLQALAERGPIKSVATGDTAIGMSIEQALGIRPNSSRKPDYKGIELKSGRATLAGRATRATLFACVPNWSLSMLKSSAEILDTFGYTRGDQFKLYCTVSTTKANSQGLQFQIVDAEQLLYERSHKARAGHIAVWRLEELGRRLSEKHRETFWIKARSETRGGREWFHLTSALHTARPNVAQFDRLLALGSITMDHLIKRTAAGGAAEKGPLFKIERNRIPELFLGTPSSYIFD